jgi:hypothetical protein
LISQISLAETAQTLFPAANSKTVAQKLGTVVSVAFYDAAVLNWSGMNVTCASPQSSSSSSHSTGAAARLSCVILQTTSRLLFFSLQSGPSPCGSLKQLLVPPKQVNVQQSATMTPAQQKQQPALTAHLNETAVALAGAVPSSNCLPLTATTVLLGCADGSLKCLDWKSGTILKSIKGLGKGDWIVQLLAANKYDSGATGSGGTNTGSGGTEEEPQDAVSTRRILTLTHKGIAYWIELELMVPVSMDANIPQAPLRINIKPPLARFVVGDPGLTHTTTLQYDAARDWLLWTCPAGTVSPNNKTSVAAASPNASTTSKTPVVYGWNLQTLQTELLQQTHQQLSAANKTPNLPKPDPNMTVHIPATSDLIATLTPCLHTAFSEDTLVLTVGTTAGELHWMAARVISFNKPAVLITASTCMAVPVVSLLQQAAADADDWPEHYATNMSLVKIAATVSRPLGLGQHVVVATNVGVLVVEWPLAQEYCAGVMAARHLHFGAGLGSLGKSVLYVQESLVLYGSLDVLTANPAGYMAAKNPVTVYESPAASHLPAELQRRPYRAAPVFLPSPSGAYACLFWAAEYRYEVLHISSLMQRVGQRGNSMATTTRNPAVATGTNIQSFCWVGDDADVFAVIHCQPDWSLVIAATEGSVLAQQAAAAKEGGEGVSFSTNLLDVRAQAMNVKNVIGQSVKLTKNVSNVAMSAGQSSMNLAMSAGQSSMKVATSATKASISATKAATKVGLSATKAATSLTMNVTTSATKVVRSSVKTGVKKSFGLFGVKSKKKKEESDNTIYDDDDDNDLSEAPTAISSTLSMPTAPGLTIDAMRPENVETKRTYVELRSLVAMEQSAEISASVPAATSSTLGEISLRGGNRNPPTCLWGGPVLCVASRSEDGGEGHAHFYTRKGGETDDRASVYVSSGPTLPFPDLVAWDDDGYLCAVVVRSRVAIYLSNMPDFVMLGTVRIGPAFDSEGGIISAKFVHGVLYCCTSNSVHCVFLGNTEEGICRLDTYMLASTDVPATSGRSSNSTYTSLTPPAIPLPLIQPVVLGYQSGSLMVSTARGVFAIPLSHPLMRIGTLLAAGQIPSASKWFDAVPESDHEALAVFLERRGHPELALELSGISLETIVDTTMRYGFTGRLEEVVEAFGVKGLRAIDMGRGVSTSIFGPEQNGNSVVVCVGAYLLAHGRVELARRLATECLRSGEDGRKDAFILATLLLSVDETDARRLISRAVEEESASSDWIMGNFVREYMTGLSDRT